MELRDLIVTPILIILVYVAAYIVRPYVTDDINRRYFFPGLTVRIIGALAVGFIYQFYYEGGDTFNFHTHGSRHIWEAFMDDPAKGLKLVMYDGSDTRGIHQFASRIYFLNDPSSFAIIKLAALLDLITFSSYSATAVLFAVIGFIGLWLLFITFYEMNHLLHRWIALVVLFVPSVIFWGSGLLKDTITLACLGACTFCTYRIFICYRFSVANSLLLLLSLYGLYVIKIYILLTFLPAAIMWLFLYNLNLIKSVIIRIMVFPIVIALAVVCGYFAMLKASEDNPKYALASLAKTAQITAYDIRFWTGRDAGSGYTLGELDGSWQSMLKLSPQAINVSLFRPFFWEVKNPLMLLSAIESFGLLLLTSYAVFGTRGNFFKAAGNPTIFFCLMFSISFAFAVGVSTYNFGTLVRYKIPMLPFYLMALVFIINYSNSERKLAEFESTE